VNGLIIPYAYLGRSVLAEIAPRFHYFGGALVVSKHGTILAEHPLGQEGLLVTDLEAACRCAFPKKGAHLLLQVRAQVLNEDLRSTFERWYPAMTSTDVSAALVA
jgi:hypothetical protein